jgi:putative ABC transport system permease protein
MLHEIRYAVRCLRHKPGFALTAIVSIALGIGANAAIFSLADGLLLRPLPVPGAARVVNLSMRTPSGGYGPLSFPDYVDMRDRSRSFDGVVAFHLESCSYAPDSHTQAQLKTGYLVSANFFTALGVTPALGRGFAPREDRVPGRDAVVILAHDFWRTEFDSAPDAIGRRIRLSGQELTVIGVAPESFTGMDNVIRPAFFVPLAMGPALLRNSETLLTDRANRSLAVRGRLKYGVSMESASAEVAAMAHALEQAHPETNRGFGALVRSELRVRLDEDAMDGVLVGALLVLVMLVLAIACANVANLMLSRGRARAKEIALRLALGAGRAQLVRQLMMESLIIALAGGALGLLIASFGVRAFSTIQTPGDLPVQLQFELDGRVLWFTSLLSIASALLFGLVPALRSTRTDLVTALKSGGTGGRLSRLLGRNALVTLQVAAAMVLLVAATQLTRAFSLALTSPPGFRIDHLLALRLDTTLAGYNAEQTERFQRSVVERAREVPGVVSASLDFSLPMTTDFRPENVIPEGYQFPKGKDRAAVLSDTVDEGFFATLGVPLVRGRGFLVTDRAGAPPVVVVNEAFANRYLGPDPIGKRIRLKDAKGPLAEVVGVTVTGKHISIFEPPTEFIYLPLRQNPLTRVSLLVETRGDPSALEAPLRQMIHGIDPGVPAFGVRTMADLYDQRSVRVAHMIDAVVGSSGLVGLCLALVGLYAVVAFQVARRTREIGIRVALGADRTMVTKLVIRQALWIGCIGVAIGTVLSAGSGQALHAGLGAPAFNPLIFAGFAASLLAAVLAAAAIPARRAARIDPMQALREE